MGALNNSSAMAGPLWHGLGWLIVVLSAYVAFDLFQRVRGLNGHANKAWLAAAGTAWASGLLAAHVLGLSTAALGFPLGYQPVGLFFAWVATAAIAVAGLAVSVRGSTLAFNATSGGVLAVGGLLVPLGACASMGLLPEASWYITPLVLAVLAALLGGLLGAWLFLHGRFHFNSRWPRLKLYLQPLAAAAVGTGVWLAEAQVLNAVDPASYTSSSHADLLPAASLGGLAAVGVPALLGLLLTISRMGLRMQGAPISQINLADQPSGRDRLTGLPNPALFDGAFAQAVRAADERKEHFALLMVDLDGFRGINQIYGQEQGDQVLCEVARRLRKLAPGAGSLCRLRDDKFLVMLTGNPQRADVVRLATELKGAVDRPYKLDKRPVPMTCSIGIAMYPEHGAMSTLKVHAEAAVRASKGQGGGTYAFFDGQSIGRSQNQVELLKDLREALAKGQLELYYQPKIHAPSGEITGAEALMRWHHPQRGIISPEVFIPIAERFGLISALGFWVIDQACRQAGAWRDDGLRMRVAINLSVYQLHEPDLVERMAAAMEKYGIEPKLLTCEITESMAMDDAETTKAVFGKLKQLGVPISIDDFGTGASSLAQLRKLRPEELKIDRSFVLDLATSRDARAVVDAVVKLAQALSIKVVAEGVETEAQHDILRTLGCNELQGYLFAKPMSASALAAWAMSAVGPRSLSFRESLFVQPGTGTAVHKAESAGLRV